MLSELRVENVGVIADLTLVFGPGMTAVTGETGAGKTLVVEAVELLLGARADPSLVRAGAAEARVEARFTLPEGVGDQITDRTGLPVEGDELVVTRVIPAQGRSRAYLNGRLAAAGALSVAGDILVDLHGQHSHRALLTPATQRAALDRFCGKPAIGALAEYRTALNDMGQAVDALAALGGDDRDRARELDLLQFQIDEIEAAGISALDEDDRLAAEEAILADAALVVAAAAAAAATLDVGASDALMATAQLVDGVPGLDEALARIRVLQDEVSDVSRSLRSSADTIEEDPERLEAIAQRRALFRELRRKYGESLSDIVGFANLVRERLADLRGSEVRAAELQQRAAMARRAALAAAARLSTARTQGAERLAVAVQQELRDLGMPEATFAVAVETRTVGDTESLPHDGLDDVIFLLGANRGEPTLPLARVASGGEMARTMLAARVVLTDGAPTLIFDEVDAGIGGQAGVSVGRKLALVARHHQVLCVTHLAQVAAFADAHAVIEKRVESQTKKRDDPSGADGRTVADARFVDGGDRVTELSRMLSGSGTEKARRHAQELLASAGQGA